MTEIFQQFGGMTDGALSYRNAAQERMTAAEDHVSLVRGLESGAWMDPTYDDYFVSAKVGTDMTHQHGVDLNNRGTVVDQCVMDGESTLATTRGIAQSLVV
jgi:hypothetical protein